MVDFTDVLSQNISEVEKPKPKPVGTYLGVIQGMPKQRAVTPKAGGDDMPVMAFTIKLIAPIQVDAEKLADAPEISTWGTFQHDMFLHTEGGIYAFKQFLTQTLGIDGSDKTLAQAVAEAPGKQVAVTLKHEPYVNRSGEAEIGTRIESIAAA